VRFSEDMRRLDSAMVLALGASGPRSLESKTAPEYCNAAYVD
jgi:hypothetical protein